MNCDATYIGQTKRQLNIIIKEHQSDINKKSNLSVISCHRSDTHHEFDWQNVKIMDEECSYTMRLTSEMIFIKRQIHGINKQSNTDLLPDQYIPLIDLLPNT